MMICHVLQVTCHLKNENIINFKFKYMRGDENCLNLKQGDQNCLNLKQKDQFRESSKIGGSKL